MFQFSRRGARVEWRLFGFGLLILAAFAALIAKLWWEQVARGPFWTRKIASRSEVRVRIPSTRGEIRDRNGIILVQNRGSREVEFMLPDMVRGYRQQHDGEVPIRKYKGTERQMAKERKVPDIVEIVKGTVIPRLQELKLAKDFNAARLERHYETNAQVPFTYWEELDFPTLARFAEHDVGLPGVQLSTKPVRQYVYGAMAAHLLGYVGLPNEVSALPDVRAYDFYQPDVEGKTQVEYYLDKWIRGTAGVRVMQRSAKGVIEGTVREEPPKQGHNVFLTIDARIQYIVERALREVGRAAAVVVDPNNGEILAMASVPSYNPNLFIPSISPADWKQLLDDDTDPLTNRAIQSYAPGSTYKTVAALAGLRKGLTSRSAFTCSGGVQYGAKFMKCWIADKGGAHGTLGLSEALKVSCNAFFYQWANAATIEQIDAVGDALMLGRKTGVPLSGENGGILPGPEWLRLVNPNDRWSSGRTANTGIGQGEVETSPLQMAMVMATIANRGVSYEPRLIHRVLSQQGEDAREEDGKLVAPHQPTVRADLRRDGISKEEIELVRRGMWKVVNEAGGTGKRAQIKGVDVAGKTGTAQFWRLERGQRIKDNHTWFISFAPYEQPRYAVCVFVQGAKSGGGVSAPIAQKILEECFAIEKGWDPGLASLEPAKGSFAPIELVDYKKSAVPSELKPDEETADHTEEPPHPSKTREKHAKARPPTIRADADAAGRVGERVPVRPPVVDRRNFLERFFGPRTKNPVNPAPPRQSPTRPAGR